MTDSWRLKLCRAEKHLADLKALLGPVVERHPHPVSEAVETQNGVDRYVYRLAMEPVPRERAAILAGDFLFNVRSALDHLTANLVAPKNKGKVQFPIFVEDPLTLAADGVSHINTKAWAAWNGKAKLIPSAPLAAITALQPFENARKHGENPDNSPLTILQTFQNADKHSQLTLAIAGVEQIEITAGTETTCWRALFPDGAEVFAAPEKVDVKLTGATRVIFGTSYREMRPYPELFDTILRYACNEVVPLLERYFPKVGPN